MPPGNSLEFPARRHGAGSRCQLREAEEEREEDSEVNELRGLVRQGVVTTPFGPVSAAGHADGSTVLVVIRPEGLRLTDGAARDDANAFYAKVMAARLLGRSSWVHLDVGGPAGSAAGQASADAAPRHTTQFLNTVTYKRFSFTALLDWRNGGHTSTMTKNLFDRLGDGA